MTLNKCLKICLLSAFCLSVSSCQILTGIDGKYPDRWPELAASHDECPDISGSYVNKGRSEYYFTDNEKYLSYYIFLEDLLQLDSADEFFSAMDSMRDTVVRIEKYDSVFNIEFVKEGAIISRRSLRSDSSGYVCKKGILWIDVITDSIAEGLGYARSKHILGLQNAVDGSLVGQLHVKSIGVFLWVVPVGGKQVFWLNWHRL